ncbi:MAG: gyrase subunit, partial [Bacillota bacterium]
PELLLNNLYKYTSLQISFGVNMLALVNGEPKVLNLRELIFHYLEHQIEVVKRRTKFELDKAIDRAHILEGYRIALDNIDQIISLIRGSKTTKEARDKLMQNFELSEKQAQAILDMRLQRLTGLERDKIEDEYKQLQKDIKYYRDLLADEYKLKQVVRDELEEVRIKHGDQRKTAIISAVDDIVIGDLIPRSEVAIILTHRGYIKRLPLKTYRLQHRGGKGVTGMGTKEDDFVAQLFVTDSHNDLLFFSNKGKVYRLKAYEVPELGRSAKGTPIINMLQIEKGEQIQTVLSLKEDEQSAGLLFATKYGVIKKTALQDFVNIRRGGLLAIKLRSEDELVAIHLVGAGDEVIIGTAKGQAIRFKQSDVREMGRATTGVRAISLRKDDHVIDMDIVDSAKDMLLVTTRGYGKRTKVLDYRTQTRGGKGIRSIGLTPRKGDVVAQALVARDDDLMIITKVGMVIRVKASEISLLGRYAQGVRLINLKKDSVANIALAPKSDA